MISAGRPRVPFPFRRDVKKTDEKGNTLMTPEYLRQICRDQGLYTTPELNDKIYLHFQGFARLEGLDGYTGLKSLWLEGNGISKIENINSQTLEHLKELRCLFLQQNCIEKLENLDQLELLDTLNVSNNLIKKIENIAMLPMLKTLQIADNFLRTAEDIEHLRDCKHLTVLDLSNNKLEDPAIVDVLASMESIAVINLMKNPVIRNIPNYRRIMISKIKTLTYLDDRPVFDKERLATEAWAIGGIEAEREERERQRREEREAHDRNMEALRQLQAANISRRIEVYGEDTEPQFSAPLENFKNEQLKKIEEPAVEAPIAMAAEPEVVTNTARKREKLTETDEPQVREYVALDTQGHVLVVGEEAPVHEVTVNPILDVKEDEPMEPVVEDTERTLEDSEIPALENADPNEANYLADYLRKELAEPHSFIEESSVHKPLIEEIGDSTLLVEAVIDETPVEPETMASQTIHSVETLQLNDGISMENGQAVEAWNQESKINEVTMDEEMEDVDEEATVE